MVYRTLEKLQMIFHDNENCEGLMKGDSFNLFHNVLPDLRLMEDRKSLLLLLQLEDHPLPLELVNLLHKENIILFSTYLYWRRNTVVHEIVTELLYLVIDNYLENQKNRAANVLRDILIILSTFGAQSLPELYEITSNILVSFIEQVSLKVMNLNEPIKIVSNYLQDMTNAPFVIKSKLIELFKKHLNIMIQHNSNVMSAEDAIAVQLEECIPQTYMEPVTLIFQTIFNAFERKSTFMQLMLIITSNQFNWKSLLIAVSVYYTTFPEEGPESFKVFIDGLLRKALKESSTTTLVIVLLLVRQCCASEIPFFTSYPNWIESLHLKNQQEVQFFYSFLEQIIPREPAIFLKVQVNKSPAMPLSCRKIFTNYVGIAKSRLKDLNETTEYVGLFNDFHILSSKKVSDVDKVLTYFRENNEIMSTVLEASVLRKQFFTDVFLPELLFKSSTNEACNSVKTDFIELLYKGRIIPSTLYFRWKSTVCSGV